MPEDNISLQTSIDMAKQSYIRGCMDAQPSPKKTHQMCLEKSNDFIKNNISEILNQN